MSFPRYPKYKDSGAEWLGEVPDGWEVKRSDSFLTYSRAQLDPVEFKAREVFHYSIPVVQESGTGQLEDGSEISSGKQVVKKKVVLVSKLNPRKGTICIAEPQQALTLCSTEFVALEPNRCDIRYLNYLVRTEGFRQELESKATSVTNSHQRANPVDIYRFWNAWPALSEQTAIAGFLDRETEKIDGLVAEQRRLMDLLKEKRQAVILHAVTKGINSHAPMKSSGIDWLGDVPKHWRLHRIKHQFKTCSGSTPSTGQQGLYYTDSEVGIPWMRTTDLPNDKLRSAEVFITERALSDTACSILPIGSVLVAMYGGDGTIGKNGLLEIPAAINQAVCGILPSVQFNPEYVFRYIQFYRPYWMVGAESSRCDPNISQERVRNTPFLKPPLEEQVEIVSFLNRALTKFDALTAEAQRAIDLLQERRTALISAAVTGQIDVRNSLRN